jgi:uncharacterized membrane protein YjgN (DUF898 family)
MFGLSALSISTHARSSLGLWLSEALATFGLVVLVFALARGGRAALAPFAVGAYITAAYWWSSSTSFANPMIDVARTLSNTFAGIAPTSVPMFVLMQLLGGAAGVAAAALLYPAFQAIVLRWWTSGLRFGTMAAKSRLRIGQMYGLYLRFLGYSLLFGLAVGLASTVVFGLAFVLFRSLQGTQFAEIAGIVGGVAGYVVVMLGYSTIYQITVKLRVWRLSFETLELTGLEQLEHVKAAGAASSAFGEGLADALDVGGL